MPPFQKAEAAFAAEPENHASRSSWQIASWLHLFLLSILAREGFLFFAFQILKVVEVIVDNLNHSQQLG